MKFCILQDSNVVEKDTAVPTLDIKNLKVPELRAELAARNLSTKGNKFIFSDLNL